MGRQVAGTLVHTVEHGHGTPVLVLHGAGVDHREAVAAFEPTLRAHGGLRRVYPDLPGAGLTPAPETVSSAADVLDVLSALLDDVAGERRAILVGHSAGAYYARALADRAPRRVEGLVLVCPLLEGARDVPEHEPVVADGLLGDDEFRAYFVVQTQAMLETYRRAVAPGAALADEAAARRIGARRELAPADGPPYAGPVLVVAGRQDSVVGHAAAVDLLSELPHVTLAVVDGAGHALPHEKQPVLRGLLEGWLTDVLGADPDPAQAPS